MPIKNNHIPRKIIYKRENGTSDVFLVHEKLGSGGYAVVYRVTHQNTGKSYAMKIISKRRYNNSNSQMFLEKMKNETNIQKNLDHPNIVHSKLSFSDDFNLYIVLEFCPGRSIREYLRKSGARRLNEFETRKILKDVVQGLIYLHNRNIIHHDIKLENFIIGADGRVKISDFGISSVMNNKRQKNYVNCGTLGYMCPEMVLDDNCGHGFEADIWAVGVSAFVMLTGRMPFDGNDILAVKEKIKNCSYFFPQMIPQLSFEAKDFIESILVVDPRKRPSLVDLIEHPFLSKIDKKPIQLYKKTLINQKDSLIQNNCIRKFLPPAYSVKKNLR